MPWVRDEQGRAIHIRTSKRVNLCSCRRFATLQCDWPKESGGTCDNPICRFCARHVGPDVDYCPFHRGDPPMTEEQKKAAGEAAANEAAKILGVKRGPSTALEAQASKHKGMADMFGEEIADKFHGVKR